MIWNDGKLYDVREFQLAPNSLCVAIDGAHYLVIDTAPEDVASPASMDEASRVIRWLCYQVRRERLRQIHMDNEKRLAVADAVRDGDLQKEDLESKLAQCRLNLEAMEKALAEKSEEVSRLRAWAAHFADGDFEMSESDIMDWRRVRGFDSMRTTFLEDIVAEAAASGKLAVLKWLEKNNDRSLLHALRRPSVLLRAAFASHLGVVKWLINEKGVRIDTVVEETGMNLALTASMADLSPFSHG